MDGATLYVGVDLGGTRMRMAAVGRDGRLATEVLSVPTGREFGPEDLKGRLGELAQRLRGSLGQALVTAMGFGTAGVVGDGPLTQCDNLPRLNGVDVAALVATVAACPVTLENDARCFTLAEARFGAGRGARNVVGITLGTGYRYDPEISFDLGQQIGGPSAGLVFALAIYDKITNGPLLAGRHLAGTGTITPDGDVQAIGGIQEKIAAAQKAGATAFFVPANNCRDLEGVRTSMTLIKVATLNEAIKAVQAVNSDGDGAVLPRC